MPALLLIGTLIIFGGRYAMASQAVQVAAAEAARAISLARSAAAADATAENAARQALASRGMACASTQVALDASGLAAPPGTTASARATVSCTVRTSDLLPLLPGSRTLTATAVSPIDTYRE